MDVRVDGGPQDGTILVTWIPVTLNTTSAQRVVPVTGYAVFADGKRVTDVDSPSSDHALVDLGIFLNLNPGEGIGGTWCFYADPSQTRFLILKVIIVFLF